MKLRMMGAMIALLMLTLHGCGGDHSITVATAGRATFTLVWPARTRLIPHAANSVQITLSQNGTSLASQLLARPAQGGTVTANFTDLPVGNLTATATAYPQADGTGTAQATATVPVTTAGGQVTTVHLTMATTIAAVTIAPGQSVAVGQTLPLQFTATDAGGNVVIVANTEATVTVVSGPGSISASNGQILGLRAGPVTLSVTIEGVISPTQTLSVTLQTGTVWSWGVNIAGVLGTGNDNTATTPTPCFPMPQACQRAAARPWCLRRTARSGPQEAMLPVNSATGPISATT